MRPAPRGSRGSALGAILSAATWLPALRYGAHTHRALADFAADRALGWSVDPADLLALAWPHAAGYGGAGYHGGLRATDGSHTLGLAGFALACAGAFAAGRGIATARMLGALATLGALLALGPRLPVLGGALLGVPPFSMFRTPVSWLLLAELAGALLAARGFEALVAAPGDRACRARLVAGAVALVLALGLGLARASGAAHAFGDLALQCALAGATVLALAWAAWPGARAAGVAKTLGVVGGMAALALLAWPLLERATGERAGLGPRSPTPLARNAAGDERQRAFPGGSEAWFSNAWVSWRVRQPGGLHGAVPLAWEEAYRNRLFQADGFARACAMRLTDVAAEAYADTERFAWGEDVIERLDALPRAYAVGRVTGVPDLAALRQAAWDPSWDPEAVAYVAGAGSRDYPGSAATTIAWVRDEPDRLALRVRAPAEAFVVIADAWFAGWSASLDGAPVPIVRVNHLLRGVAVPAGDHALELRYVPEGWRAGVGLSRAGWLAFALALAAWAWARTRGPWRPGARASG